MIIKAMNYTFDKSKFSKEKLKDVKKCQDRINGLSKDERKTKCRILLRHYMKSYNINKPDIWNFILYYFMELGFNYSEILTAYMDIVDPR